MSISRQGMKMSENEKITIRLPKSFLDRVDFLVEMDDFTSRSEAIRTAVRDLIYYRAEFVLEKSDRLDEIDMKIANARARKEKTEEYLKR